MTIHEILKHYWGYDSFRPLQEDIILSAMSGRDTLALMPTGGGKSITYQVPGILMEGVCLVVTPLIALMKDQVEELEKRGVPAGAVYTGMNREDVMSTLNKAIAGKLKFLYLSPERLASAYFRERLKQMHVSLWQWMKLIVFRNGVMIFVLLTSVLLKFVIFFRKLLFWL